MFVVITRGWLVAEPCARPAFSSCMDGQASLAWRFLGPSINLDRELRKRRRCGAALGPWTPARTRLLEKLGPSWSFCLSYPSSLQLLTLPASCFMARLC